MARKQTMQLLEGIKANLTEKRNPENDEANELIRKALDNQEYAKNHATELRQHGIKYIKPTKNYGDAGALEGKEGRRLKVNPDPSWRSEDSKEATHNYNSGDSYSTDYSGYDSNLDRDDLHQKSYKQSKLEVKDAKDNIDKQAKKVARMQKKDKEAGVRWNEKTYNAKNTLDYYKNTIDRGIRAKYANSDKIHKDVDLKSFLNAKKHSDRELPAEKEPGYMGGKNKTVNKYKEVKSERRSIESQKAENKKYDDEDRQRIEDMKKRAAEEKERRDKGLAYRTAEVDKMDSDIQDRLKAYRDRMAKRNNK